MYDPASEGFSQRMCAIDRCQIGLLRALATHYGSRLYLKGGMAMRALFGSMRLTKDIDFERDPSLSNESLRRALPRALQTAALTPALLAPSASITKDTRTTIRASLAATLMATAERVQFDVEISGRGLPPREHLIHLNLAPPVSYRMAQFGISSFDAHAMAASKLAALLSDSRSVPRDIFDLNDLIAQDANPVPLLARADRNWLRKIRGTALERVSAIGWDRANEELLPYLPKALRNDLSKPAWEESCLRVADAAEAWIDEALAR